MKIEFNKILKSFIFALSNFGIFKKVFTVTYKGKGVSINDYYSSSHWTTRKHIKTKYGKIFKLLIKEAFKDEKINQYIIIVFYNNNYDVDNVTGIEKIFVDELRACQVTLNDTKKYFKAMIISEDSSLEKNTFQFLVCKIS